MNILAKLNLRYRLLRSGLAPLTATILTLLIFAFTNNADETINYVKILSTFILWAFSILGLGATVSKATGLLTSPANNFILGLASSAFIVGGLLLCQIPQTISPLLLILLASGIFLFFCQMKIRHISGESISQVLNVPGLALIIYVLLRSFQSLTPDMHPDALWYHLSGPLFWFNAGAFKFNPDGVQLAQASYWECLYLWPLYFLGSSTTSNLLNVQIFAQLITVSTWLAASLAAANLLKKIIPLGLNKQWSYLVILAALTTSELALSYPTPKNDWGVAAFFIMALQALIQSHPGLAGALLGMSFVSKFSYAIPVGLTLIVGLCYLQTIRRKGILLLAFALFAAPILFRNFAWTGNPFFPLFNSIFKSEYLPAIWQESLNSYNGAGSTFDFNKLILLILSAFPLNQALTILLLTPKIKMIAASFWSKRLTLITGLSILLFAAISGPRAELRLIGVIPIIIGAASVYALYLFRNSFIIRIIPNNLLPVIAALYLIIFSETPWFKITQEYNFHNQRSLVYPEPYTKLDPLSSVIKSKDKMLFAYDTRSFYFLNEQGVRIWDSLRLSNLFEKSETTKIVEVISDEFRYLIVTNTVIDNFHRTEPIQQIQKLAKNHPESIITDNNEGMLIDLFILRSHLMGTKE